MYETPISEIVFASQVRGPRQEDIHRAPLNRVNFTCPERLKKKKEKERKEKKKSHSARWHRRLDKAKADPALPAPRAGRPLGLSLTTCRMG